MAWGLVLVWLTSCGLASRIGSVDVVWLGLGSNIGLVDVVWLGV